MTAPTWTMYVGPPGGLPPGPEGIRELFRQIGPIEQEFTIEDLIAEGDKVVRATNRCELRELLWDIQSWPPADVQGNVYSPYR
jgi:hypothetical protein